MSDIFSTIAQYIMGINPAYSLSGLLVGILVGLTGVGGGSLMTPILVLFFGIHPATAVGTDLLYASITKACGTAVHGGKKNVDWKIVGLMSVGSIPAALIAIGFIHHFGESREFAKFMQTLLGFALIITSILVIMRNRLIKYVQKQNELTVRNQAIMTIIVGVILGALVSLTSVGAGALGVTAMILLYHRLPLVKLVGTDIAHAVPLTLVAGMGYFLVGSVDIEMLISLLLGSVPGIIIGSWLAPKLPERAVRYTLSTVLVLVGFKMIFK